MAALSSESESWTSNAIQDDPLGNPECPSDDEFVHIHLTSTQKGTAMAALSSILHSEKAIGACFSLQSTFYPIISKVYTKIN